MHYTSAVKFAGFPWGWRRSWMSWVSQSKHGIYAVGLRLTWTRWFSFKSIKLTKPLTTAKEYCDRKRMSWGLQLHPRGCFIELTSGCSQLMVLITSLLVKSWEISCFKSVLYIPSSGKSNASVCSQEKGGFNFPMSCVFLGGRGRDQWNGIVFFVLFFNNSWFSLWLHLSQLLFPLLVPWSGRLLPPPNSSCACPPSHPQSTVYFGKLFLGKGVKLSRLTSYLRWVWPTNPILGKGLDPHTPLLTLDVLPLFSHSPHISFLLFLLSTFHKSPFTCSFLVCSTSTLAVPECGVMLSPVCVQYPALCLACSRCSSRYEWSYVPFP